MHRVFFGAAILIGALAAMPAKSQGKTLRVVPEDDLKILDPTFTTAYSTRNFGYLVYDTPFGLDDAGQPQPQMVERYTTSPDGRLWTFRLRPGLKFSDGSPVTSADVVASMQRWTARDAIGRTMTAMSAGEWKVLDGDTFTLTLKEPFGLVLAGMAKSSGYPAMVMPERLAKLSTTQAVPEVVGSGPYIFKRDEWVPGNKVVFVRNPHYASRAEPPRGMAGGKKPYFDRIEWISIPDGNTAVAALAKGEVDLVEQVSPDHLAALRGNPDVRLLPSGTRQGWLVMNHLHPPFNNPKIRQALLKAINKDRFLASAGIPREQRPASCVTFFICGGAHETDAGAAPWRAPDIDRARQLLAEAGYKGEKVVLLTATDDPTVQAHGQVLAETLKSLGMRAEVVATDWPTLVARRAKKDTADAGGWSIYTTTADGFDADSPVTNAYLGASCGNSLPGWPCDKPLDDLRIAWTREADPVKRRQLLDQFHARAFEALPHINLGQYPTTLAVRKGLKGAEKLGIGLPVLWALHE